MSGMLFGTQCRTSGPTQERRGEDAKNAVLFLFQQESALSTNLPKSSKN